MRNIISIQSIRKWKKPALASLKKSYKTPTILSRRPKINYRNLFISPETIILDSAKQKHWPTKTRACKQSSNWKEIDIRINTSSLEEKKQTQSNLTSKSKRGKKRTNRKGYKQDQPATKHERSHMPDISPEIHYTRSKRSTLSKCTPTPATKHNHTLITTATILI